MVSTSLAGGVSLDSPFEGLPRSALSGVLGQFYMSKWKAGCVSGGRVRYESGEMGERERGGSKSASLLRSTNFVSLPYAEGAWAIGILYPVGREDQGHRDTLHCAMSGTMRIIDPFYERRNDRRVVLIVDIWIQSSSQDRKRREPVQFVYSRTHSWSAQPALRHGVRTGSRQE